MKIYDHQKFQAVVTFVLVDGTVITSIEHEIGLENVLKTLVKKVGHATYYHLSYPRSHPPKTGIDVSDFPENQVGTPATQVMIAVSSVDRIWYQHRGDNY